MYLRTVCLLITVPPTAALNITASVLSSTSVSLSWSHPFSDGGTDITNYLITYWSSADDHMTVDTNSLSLTTQLFDLVPYTTYQFLLRAENAVGTGPASVSVEAMTLVGGKCLKSSLRFFVYDFQLMFTDLFRIHVNVQLYN